MPIELFTWDVVIGGLADDEDTCACGVNSTEWEAIDRLGEALDEVPCDVPVSGRVTKVHLDMLAQGVRSAYVTVEEVARARRGDTGVIVWAPPGELA